MSTVAIDRTHGATATTELLVLEPVAERLGLAPVLLMPGEIHIGSGTACQVRLSVPGVQELHCVLTCSRSRISVRAVDRRTWINNLVLSEGRLKLGDRLAIGPVEYRVRQAEPWDILPTPEPLPIAKPVTVGIPVKSEPESIARVDARLLQQIANLEAEITRHQAAVVRLEQPPASVADATKNVGAKAGSIRHAPTEITTPVLSQSLPQAKLVSPVFHLSPATAVPGPVADATKNAAVDVGGIHHAELASLRAELKSQRDQASRQLAELSLREAGFDKQCRELAAQWQQVHTHLNEEDAAAIERCQREQELSGREQRCAVRESVIDDREQQLGQLLEQVEERDTRNQTIATRIADQGALLDLRERSLDEIAGRLAVGRDELEQQRAELEQRRSVLDERQTELTRLEAACCAKQAVVESNAVALHIDRQAAESEWARRLEDLDQKHKVQQSQADELARFQQALDQAAATTHAGQTQWAAERVRLAAWNDELARLQTEFLERDRDLKAQASYYQTRSDELEQQQAAWRTTDAQSQQFNERLAAEQIRLATWSEELARQQAALSDQRRQLESRATIQESRDEQISRQFADCEAASAQIRLEQLQLTAEQTRLAAWGEELAGQQAALSDQRWQLESRAAVQESRDEQISRQFVDCEAASAQIRLEQAQLTAERTRLAAWGEELVGQQAALSDQRWQLESRAAAQESRDEQISRQFADCEAASAQIRLEQAQLTAEQIRLATWSEELGGQQAALSDQRRQLESRAAVQESRDEQISRQFVDCEAASAQIRLEQAQLTAEQTRLTSWSEELTRQQVNFTSRQQELDALASTLNSRSDELFQQQAVWEGAAIKTRQEQTQLAEEQTRLEASSQELRHQQAHLEQARQELFLAECELETVEADLDEFELHLQSRASELATREDTLNHAECELAWQHRAAELALQNASTADADVDWLADGAASWPIEMLAAHSDALATELFVRTIVIEDLAGHTDTRSHQLRLQSEQLQHDIETCHKLSAELVADRQLIAAERGNLEHRQCDWQAEQRASQADFEVRQLRLSVETEQIQSQAGLLQSSSEELTAKWEQLVVERQTFDQDGEQFRTQQAEFARQRESLELRQTQLADSTAEHLAATAFQAAERSAWEQDMAATRAALRDREESMCTAQAELDRLRHAVDLDREEWELQRKYSPALATPEPRSAHVLDEISRLEHLVRDELDHDSRSACGNVAAVSNDWHQDDNAAHDQIVVEDFHNEWDSFDARTREEEIPPEALDDGIPDGEAVYGSLDPVSAIDYGTTRSLWSADAPDIDPTDHDAPHESAESAETVQTSVPVSEADQTILNLRARLAAMFNLDTPAGEDRDAIAEDEAEPYAEVIEPEDFEPEDTAAASPGPVHIEAHAHRTPQVQPSVAAEPEADEYDSVESYMERLLDRNRKSRSFDEPVVERSAPTCNSAPASVATCIPAASQVSHVLESQLEPEAVRVPVVREPVDMQKIRAGLVNLRQVANVSARHAIARSKWNKMRIRIAVQCLLTGGCGLVGVGILTGKITGLVTVSAWGWVAVAMGAALAIKIVWDIRSIFHGEPGVRKPSEPQPTSESGERGASAP